MKFIACKYNIADPTFVEIEQKHYSAETLEKAVDHCFYLLKMVNQAAYVGPSGQVIYDGFGFYWCLTPTRIDLDGNHLVYRDGEWHG